MTLCIGVQYRFNSFKTYKFVHKSKVEASNEMQYVYIYCEL